MTGWKHVEETSYGYAANREGEGSWWVTPCDCETPTPDPTSPCGVPECAQDHWVSGYEGIHDTDMGQHAIVPTRCLCGHALVPA